jgi:hypothetical protein
MRELSWFPATHAIAGAVPSAVTTSYHPERSTYVRLMVCKNFHYGRIAWDELFDWQRAPSLQRVNFVYTDDLDMRRLWGHTYDESEVMLCECWDEGQYWREVAQELRRVGLNLNSCGRLYYD